VCDKNGTTVKTVGDSQGLKIFQKQNRFLFSKQILSEITLHSNDEVMRSLFIVENTRRDGNCLNIL
jgi:hypothetical protein